MAKSRNGLTAVGLSVLGAFLVLLAFTTKNWLVTNVNFGHPKFERIGLWVVCFKDFEDPLHWFFNTRFHSCWWVFEEEYYIIDDILFKGLYIATQFFFSTCLLLTVFAVCSTIALIIFGSYADSRVWMPNWEHNDIGWSYGVAVTGTITLYVSGVLYGIECRAHMIKCKRMDTQRDNYNSDSDDIKQMSHIDI
ncbi:hypothetical protein QTP88_001601 [Uroleucon formosanum]